MAEKQYRCLVCGNEFTGDLPADFQCPVCGCGAAQQELVKE
ncbi:rubredoxin [Eubacteriales bacterium OttesenSCG-928-M02]|nr:rubredoxin [Eubacteriales bacterium OttesenSCG-928-M02]